MAIFNFELTRTYSTSFEIEAENQKEAFKKFQSLGEEMFSEEMEQCNVINQSVEGDKYARICSCCGDGMNEGYFVDYDYYCSDTCLHTEYTPEEWKNLYEQSEEQGGDYCYWTQWEEDDFEYQFIDGKLQEIENVFFNQINENLGFR
jgi:hypothetical protein